jgi:hypothetical protein
MRKICMMLSLAAALALASMASGCASTDPGSREYIPGKGWVPMNQ